MSYIAFLDMLGTRATATIGIKEYTDAIYDFHNSMTEAASCCDGKCLIYGYSDNAYIQFDSIEDVITFFQILRIQLLDKHLYFSAAVERGHLGVDNKIIINKKNGCSMVFTHPEVIDVYLAQTRFSGIGISFSRNIVNEFTNIKTFSKSVCSSIYQPQTEKNVFESVIDLSYDKVFFEQIKYVISDYLSTAVINKRASRYYITPIVTMLKCLDEDVIENNLKDLVSLVTFNSVPMAFKNEINQEYPILFLFALFDFVLEFGQRTKKIDVFITCQNIINYGELKLERLISVLSTIPKEVISNSHKKQLLKIFFNLKIED